MARGSHQIAIAALGIMLLAACGGGADVTPSAAAGRLAAADITPILATTELRPGTQRFAFVLEGSSALVTIPTVEVIARVADSGADSGSPVTAVFDKWPFGTRGSYVTELAFDAVGTWLISLESDMIDGTIEFSVEVAAESVIAEIGDVAPFSNTKTLETTQGDFRSLTSHQRPDADLYQLTIAESLFSGRPSVIVFASPAFCTSPICGPQVDTVVELKDAHRDEANFIHVEVYDNPHEIQGDLTRGVYSPHLAEWGIDQVPNYQSESWTFVLGKDGRITHRFEGYATFDELDAALALALL